MEQCRNCGNHVDRKKYKNTINTFCDNKCAATYNNKTYPRQRMKPQGKCIDCDKAISTRYKRCKDCRPIYIEAASTTHYTVGQLKELYKGKNGLNLAAKIRGYGKTIYDNSDKPKYCTNCGYNKHYEVCHIKSISSFPDTATMREVHALDNLIALCPNCHWEYDHSLIGRELLERIQ